MKDKIQASDKAAIPQAKEKCQLRFRTHLMRTTAVLEPKEKTIEKMTQGRNSRRRMKWWKSKGRKIQRERKTCGSKTGDISMTGLLIYIGMRISEGG